jgi:glucosamine--fructose-6-phosphate aminotransferase (isomerizing)
MCGIYGSTKVSKFEILDQANRQRGNFASGIYYSDGKSYDFQKTEGSFNWNKIPLEEGLVYLGHNQAPTSTERVFKEHNSHPFVRDNWIVAHNGVLTNFEELKRDYIPDHENVVDSSIIPALLLMFEQKADDCTSQEKEQNVIKTVLELLEGTFGLWIVNLRTLNIYITRQGSTLFYDHNSFSSVKGTDFKEIEEGSLYRFNKKGVTKVGTFKSKSPFLEL